MNKFLITLSLLSLCVFAQAGHWAVLVAGSNGFWNYRHQADVCHAYHTLIAKGFPASNIIVFSYDDVAKDPSNPIPGTLFNKPTYSKPGVDLYKGCKIDYKGNDVIPANFLSVLKGNASAVKGIGSGRVLGSTKTDRVFLNFADHGAPGLIAFPNDYLYANDLITTFDYMFEHKMYSELVFYLEACESGSMFPTLPKNTKIFAWSAASPDESSWGTYCSPDDIVNGTSIGSCLGDLFSVNWMEDTDGKDTCKETLQDQFTVVQKLTNQSHVMEWGDLSFQKEPVGDFIGTCVPENNGFFVDVIEKVKEERNYKTVDSRDIKLFYLQNKYNKNPSYENLIALQQEELSRSYFDEKFQKIAKFNGFKHLYEHNFSLPGDLNINCIKKSIENFEQHCGKLSDYALKHIRSFALMCHYQSQNSHHTMIQSIETICKGN